MDKFYWYDDINLNDFIDRNKVFKKKFKYYNLLLFKDKWIYNKCFDSFLVENLLWIFYSIERWS